MDLIAPTEMVYAGSPRYILHFVLDYLALIDSQGAEKYRKRIDSFLGQDADWENPAAMMDPAPSISLSYRIDELRRGSRLMWTRHLILRRDVSEV